MRLIDYKEELLEEKRLAVELSEFLFTKRKFIGLNVLECDMEKLISMVIQTHQSILDYMEELSQSQGIDKDRLIERLDKRAREYLDMWNDCGYEPFAAKVEFAEEIIDWANQQPTTDGWIPVSERLPEENGRYLVTIGNGENSAVFETCYEATLQLWCDYDTDGEKYRLTNIIAWQPLPQPYKESE